MDQHDFQSRLEFRICREIFGMSEGNLSRYWCDGVMLGAFILDDPEPRLLGQAWICEGSRQSE